jgi:hypothetical protein
MDLKTEADRINHVITALKDNHYNDRLEADGTIGQQAVIACGEFLKGKDACNGMFPVEHINAVITAFKEAGFNDNLEADGDAGNQAFIAFKRFMQLAKEE